jgi:nucleoid-associated protein YgaU
MVTMAAGRPVAAMAHRREAESEGAIRTPARLTRRGRIAATAVSALLIGALSVVLATAAQATHGGTGRPGAGNDTGKYVAKVTVRPGQSLWSVAEASDPDADTRVVIQQIEQMNSLTGDRLQPGEVLWVPRG